MRPFKDEMDVAVATHTGSPLEILKTWPLVPDEFPLSYVVPRSVSCEVDA